MESTLLSSSLIISTPLALSVFAKAARLIRCKSKQDAKIGLANENPQQIRDTHQNNTQTIVDFELRLAALLSG